MQHYQIAEGQINEDVQNYSTALLGYSEYI